MTLPKNETGIPDSIVGTGSTVTHKRYSVFRIFLLRSCLVGLPVPGREGGASLEILDIVARSILLIFLKVVFSVSIMNLRWDIQVTFLSCHTCQNKKPQRLSNNLRPEDFVTNEFVFRS